MPRQGKVCEFLGCPSRSKKNSEKKFYPFIKPWVDGEKCLRWIAATGRKDFTVEDVNYHRHLCEDHFVDNVPSVENPDPLPYQESPEVASHIMSETALSGLTNNCGGTPPSGASSTLSTLIHQNALCVSASSPGGTPQSTSAPAESRTFQRPRPTEQELESCSHEDLLKRWKELDSYVDYLVAQTSSQEAELSTLREADERTKAQHSEACSRERALLRRLTAKEQEVQDYAVQVQELKNSSAPGPAALRAALLDPAVNLLVKKLRGELLVTRTRLEETQNELSAWKFTPDSNTGKRLMAKCRMLYQENEELGRIVSSGRIAKLEGELALQKSFSQEVKKSQSELDEFLQELDEDVEGMQSTIYYLQQELRKARATVTSLEQENNKLRSSALATIAPPSALPTPSESERTLNERQVEGKDLKEDGVESADGDDKGELEEEEEGEEDKRDERTKGGSPDSDRGLTCSVVDRHKSDNGDRRNNSSNNMNNNNGEDISAMLGKRTCGDDSDDSDDVPLSKKIRPNSCTEEGDVVERELPLTNGKNEEK